MKEEQINQLSDEGIGGKLRSRKGELSDFCKQA